MGRGLPFLKFSINADHVRQLVWCFRFLRFKCLNPVTQDFQRRVKDGSHRDFLNRAVLFTEIIE